MGNIRITVDLSDETFYGVLDANKQLEREQMKYTLTLVAALWGMAGMSHSENASAKVHHVYHRHQHHSNDFSKNGTGEEVKVRHGRGESGKSSYKNEPLSVNQKNIITLAYNTAKADGLRQPEVLAGIIYQESKAGEAAKFRTSKHKKACDQTVGLGQIKTKTAKSVMRRFPELKQKFGIPDSQIENALAYNDKFNVAVASKYLVYLSTMYKGDALIASYNLGEGGVKKLRNPSKLPYVQVVNKHISRLNL